MNQHAIGSDLIHEILDRVIKCIDPWSTTYSIADIDQIIHILSFTSSQRHLLNHSNSQALQYLVCRVSADLGVQMAELHKHTPRSHLIYKGLVLDRPVLGLHKYEL